MGKYDKYSKHKEPDATPTMLYFIAQELAEANRLKRLELLQNYLTIHSDAGNDPNNQSIEKDLEDQA